MMRWFNALLPKEERFFELFAQHARTLVAGAEALREMLEGGEAVRPAYQRVMDREHDADIVTRDVLIAVRRTFITPFDRGAIKELITSMDNSIDQMQKTAKAVMIFELTEFTPQMREMGDLIKRCALLVESWQKRRYDVFNFKGVAIREQGRHLLECGRRRFERLPIGVHGHGFAPPLDAVVGNFHPEGFLVGTGGDGGAELTGQAKIDSFKGEVHDAIAVMLMGYALSEQ